MRKSELLKILKVLEAWYPRRFTVDEMTVEAWFMLFANVGAEEATKAVMHYGASATFPPSPGDIITTLQRDTSGNPTPAEAWELCLESIRSKDYFAPPECGNGMAHRAMMAVGWQRIESGENREVVRAQFLKFYAEIDGNETRREQTKILGGGRSGPTSLGDGVREALGGGDDAD